MGVCVWRGGGCLFFSFFFFFPFLSFFFFFFNSLLLSGCADEWKGCVSECLFFFLSSNFFIFIFHSEVIYLFICLGKLVDIYGYSSFLFDGWMDAATAAVI